MVVEQLGLEDLPQPLEANALDGRLLDIITSRNTPVHLMLSGNHQEDIHVYVINSHCVPVVLGYPWLMKHNR